MIGHQVAMVMRCLAWSHGGNGAPSSGDVCPSVSFPANVCPFILLTSVVLCHILLTSVLLSQLVWPASAGNGFIFLSFFIFALLSSPGNVHEAGDGYTRFRVRLLADIYTI